MEQLCLRPCKADSDRGSQFRSNEFLRVRKNNGITESMGLTGKCWEVGAWIEDRYNRRRRHASLGQ
jgi:transposase InsO family protein